VLAKLCPGYSRVTLLAALALHKDCREPDLAAGACTSSLVLVTFWQSSRETRWDWQLELVLREHRQTIYIRLVEAFLKRVGFGAYSGLVVVLQVQGQEWRNH